LFVGIRKGPSPFWEDFRLCPEGVSKNAVILKDKEITSHLKGHRCLFAQQAKQQVIKKT
jgi:hypothetical protein